MLSAPARDTRNVSITGGGANLYCGPKEREPEMTEHLSRPRHSTLPSDIVVSRVVRSQEGLLLSLLAERENLTNAMASNKKILASALGLLLLKKKLASFSLAFSRLRANERHHK